MSEVSKEQLSALLDGELARDELQFLLRRIQADPALAEVWSRYQLIGDSLRGQACMPVTGALARRVMQEVDAQPAVAPASRAPRGWRWVRYGLGGGIAASVAVAALVWMQPPSELPATPHVAEQTMTASTPTLASQELLPASQLVAPAEVPDISALLRRPVGNALNVQPASALRSGSPILLQPTRNQVPPVWMQVQADTARHEPETFYLRAGSGPPRSPQPSRLH